MTSGEAYTRACDRSACPAVGCRRGVVYRGVRGRVGWVSMITGYVMDSDNIRDIAPEVLGADGRLRVLPAAYWATTTTAERALFGHRHGMYGFPTTELVEYLADLIGERSAIEIGAGHGVLADALGIVGTDSRQQEKEPYLSIYRASGQPIAPYGPNVVELDAHHAVRRFWPYTVIGSWVTHKYSPTRHAAGGNEVGVDQRDVLKYCGRYVLVGNEHVHRDNPLWIKRHAIEYPPWIYSRAQNGSRDFIAMWTGALR